MTFDPSMHPRGADPANPGRFSATPSPRAAISLSGEREPGSAWPPHTHERRPWQQTRRGGTREDRMLREIEVALPPHIADTKLLVDAALAADMESAMREIAALDNTHGPNLRALGTLLLRTESVASSKIESVEASLDDYARALHGIKSNASAVSMVATTEALDAMIADVEERGRVELDAITAAHKALMHGESGEADHAGKLREEQNWIGGSDDSPRGALYIPPPWEAVRAYLDDLMTFANRDDLPVLVQAAITHAQFESIHPFTDGNGRIGRALINTVLRRRRATTRVVVPLASALVAHRDRYFDLLNAYRHGDTGPLIASFAESSRVAASESRVTAARLADIPAEWAELTGTVRKGSAAARLLEILPSRPILSAEDATEALKAPTSRVYPAIERLREAGVLRPLTDRKRDQIWGAGLVLDELDDLGVRIARAAI
jgi:Fic family protein